MDALQRASKILDAAINAPNAYSKALAKKLLAYDTNTPGWWKEVDRLREYMDQYVGTAGGPMWEEPLIPRVPQVLAHQGLAADTAAGTATPDTFWSTKNIVIFLVGLGAGGLLLFLVSRPRQSYFSTNPSRKR